jgi:ABC-2 type transport system permease protein
MRYWINIYRAQLKIGIAVMFQYRFAVLIWAIWGFVGPLLGLAVWSAASASRGGSITSAQGASFSERDFSAYFLVFMIVSHLTMSWDAFEFAWRVRDGNLSPRLLRPILPIHGDFATNLAFKFVTSTMLLPIWGLLFYFLKPNMPPLNWTHLLVLPSLLLALVMRYVWQYCLAMFAFWTTRVEAINQFYFTLDGFLAGRIAPLSLLPGWLGVFAYYSPFRSMGYFPVELILGRVPSDQIFTGFLLQFFWLAVGIGLFRLMWIGGIKQYSAVGA